MLTAMTMRGFLPLFREKMLRLEERRSVVFCVSAAVPAPQQLGRRVGEIVKDEMRKSLKGRSLWEICSAPKKRKWCFTDKRKKETEVNRTGESVWRQIYTLMVSVHHVWHLLYIWSDVMDLCTHLVSHHFTGGSSCVCSQHHSILHQHRWFGTHYAK